MGRRTTYNTLKKPSLITATAAPSSKDGGGTAKKEGAGGGEKRKRRRHLDTPVKKPCRQQEDDPRGSTKPPPTHEPGTYDRTADMIPELEAKGEGRRRQSGPACSTRDPQRAPARARASAAAPAKACPASPVPSSLCHSPVTVTAHKKEPDARAADPRERVDAAREGWRKEGSSVSRKVEPLETEFSSTGFGVDCMEPPRESRAAQTQTEQKWPDDVLHREHSDRLSAENNEASLRKSFEQRIQQLMFQESLHIEQVKDRHQRDNDKLVEGHQQEIERQREEFEGEIVSTIDQMLAKQSKALKHEQDCTAQARANTKRLEERVCVLEKENERLKAVLGQIDVRLDKYVVHLQAAFPTTQPAQASQPSQQRHRV